MHATKSCWSGQVFATASSNESGGRKSRIRKSKEERKSMVESFILKYQKSNNGNFPSLNLTHKEVGGSFYTVREIVREIIQENRVLAPPKLSLEENGHSGFLEQHPLGSISLEPQIDLSGSDKIHMATYSLPNKYQIITSEEEYTSSSSVQYNGSYPIEVNNEEIIKEEKYNGSYPIEVNNEEIIKEERYNGSYPIEVNNEEIIKEERYNGSYPIEVNNEEIIKEETNKEDVSICVEQLDKEKEQMVDKSNEFGERIYRESEVVEILDREKYGGEDLGISQAINSHANADVVVETFPLRPVLRTVHNMDEKSGNVNETEGTLEKGEEKLLDPTVESNREYNEEKVVINLQVPSLEIANNQLAPKVSVLDIADNADLESNVTKARSPKESLISENSGAVGRKCSDRDNSSLAKGNNPMLDRINLETWEVTSKKSTRPESNPILALVKAFITSFVKFWTE